jgi:hypothetical protein
LILCILFLSCCAKQHGRGTQAVPTVEISPAENEETEQLSAPLILDGRPYVDSRGRAYRKDEAHLVIAIYCDFSPEADERWYSFEGMEQLENLRSLAINGEGEILDTIDFSPLATLSNLVYLYISGAVVSIYSFNGVEHLANLKTIRIVENGDILAGVDFTPLASLSNLEEIYFEGKITRLPDLTRLENLRSILIPGSQLESLEGIGAPNARGIEIISGKDIDSLSPLNNLLYLEYLRIDLPTGKKEYKIAEMANLPSLKTLLFYIGKIDLQGIENLSQIETLSFRECCHPFNIEGIGRLNSLERLFIPLLSPEPSLEFLRDMPNLSALYLFADGISYETVAFQVLDLSPLATLKKSRLDEFGCFNFIIKNVSALDALEPPPVGYFNLNRSRLYDETEKSRHRLVFEFHE